MKKNASLRRVFVYPWLALVHPTLTMKMNGFVIRVTKLWSPSQLVKHAKERFVLTAFTALVKRRNLLINATSGVSGKVAIGTP